MKDTDDDFFDDMEFDDFDFADDEAPMETGRINWRRIEQMKEKKWLKEQLEDFQDWNV